MGSFKGQLSLRGILIGCVGCIIITTASMYTALKMGMLPWPILFAAIVSLFFLKLFGKTNLHEVNVTHTIMSAGAMVAGGIAFTIPGIWILGYADEVSWWQMLIIALTGVVLGLICTVYLRRHFVETSKLEYPLGEATAQTLIAGDSGGAVGRKLFGAMGFAGIYTVLRDWVGAIPVMLASGIQIPGVAFGIYNSPLLLGVGFLVGTGAVLAWFIGALVGHFGIVFGGSTLGFWDIASGQALNASLGMGLMMGCGAAVVIKALVPTARSLFRGARASGNAGGSFVGSEKGGEYSEAFGSASGSPTGNARSGEYSEAFGSASGNTKSETSGNTNGETKSLIGKLSRRFGAGIAACMIAAVALVLCFVLALGPFPSIIIVLLVWVTTAMSAQSVGQTSIDPMEIFGLIVLLIVAAFSDVSQVQLFFVAGVIAVACGLTGDLMNDFKAGHTLGTHPQAQWIGQAIGGILGALVSVAVISILVQAYGTNAFGPEGSFIATQASVVATMISGIPSIPAFAIGLGVGFILYLLRLPSMMIGLGVYLPFYLSFTAFIGLLIKFIYRFLGIWRYKGKTTEEAANYIRAQDKKGLIVSSFIGLFIKSYYRLLGIWQCKGKTTGEAADYKRAQDKTGLIVSSGLLGGESFIGVIIALATMGMFLGS